MREFAREFDVDLSEVGEGLYKASEVDEWTAFSTAQAVTYCLIEYADLSVAETAEVLGKPEETVREHYEQAIENEQSD